MNDHLSIESCLKSCSKKDTGIPSDTNKTNKRSCVKDERIMGEHRRIRSEEDGIAKSTDGGIQIISPVENLDYLEAVFQGPKDSPYRDGFFTVQLQVPEHYPFKPPTIKFKTKIWHPNVEFDTGDVFLGWGKTEWSPAWTLHSVLLTILSLMNHPVLMPINFQAASQYKDDRALFVSTAELWTRVFAGTTEVMVDSRSNVLKRFSQMGICLRLAESVLVHRDWIEDAAIEELLYLGATDKSAPYVEDGDASFCGMSSLVDMNFHDDSALYSTGIFGGEPALRDEDIPLLLTQIQLIDGLEQMGFRRELAADVLKRQDWVQDAAVSELIALASDTAAAEATITIASSDHDIAIEGHASFHVEQSSSQLVQDPPMKNASGDRMIEADPYRTLAPISQTGFPCDLVESALIRTAGDEHAALEDLLVWGSDNELSNYSDDQSSHESFVIVEEERKEACESGEERSECSDWTSICAPNSP
jgi:ubiquitin-protein ligase